MKAFSLFIIIMSYHISRHIRPPRCLTNTFCLVQPLWLLLSSSTPLCFRSFATVLLREVFGLPLPLQPSGVHHNAVKQLFTLSLKYVTQSVPLSLPYLTALLVIILLILINLFSCLHIDTVWRKFMLITLGTQRDQRLQLVDNLPFYTLLHSFPIENWNNMSEGIS